MRTTHPPVSFQLLITAIEVIAGRVIRGGSQKRFVEFICQSLKQSDKEFRDLLKGFYSKRSELVHEKGIGLGFIPTFGIESFGEVPGSALWHLEIIVNAALIGFLKDMSTFN